MSGVGTTTAAPRRGSGRGTGSIAVGVDLGKTGCRARLVVDPAGDDHGPVRCHESAGPGAAGLAEPGGVTGAVTAVTAVVVPLLRDRRGDHRPVVMAVGAAGGAAAGVARALAAALPAALPAALVDSLGGCAVAVTSDAVTSHAGALSGRAGVVLAAGTGAVALGVGDDGRTTLVDGWGQWLGDEGSGTWIGRAALQAVLRARDGRGPATALSAAATDRYGDLARLPHRLPLEPPTMRATAAFVPDVVTCVRSGDAVAAAVLARAGAALAETTVAAFPAAPADPARRVEVAVVGGLVGAGEGLFGPWRAGLPAGAEVVRAEGDACDGALLLAVRTDLPHESLVSRHPGGRS